MDERRLDRWPVVLALAVVWCCLVALVSAANQVGLDGTAWRHAIANSMVASAPWVVITIGIHQLCKRVPLRRAHLLRSLAIHTAAAFFVVLLRTTWIHGLDPWMHWYDVTPSFGQVFVHAIQNNLFQYWLFVGVAHAVIYAREAIERERIAVQLEAALERAELSALAATLHPHFLFNTLQAVAEMVHRDAAAADRMIVQLSAMLRRLLDDRRPSVPLGEELAFGRDYLALEQVRFGDLLSVRWEVEPGAEDVLVPRLSIQPLIENALKHGLWPAGRPGTVVISARKHDGQLVVSVIDDGIGLTAAPPSARAGVGLSTVRARIERLYPGRGEVVVVPGIAAGVEARVVIPCEATCAS
jgi:LytS/YehU family sensor histidine kinase